MRKNAYRTSLAIIALMIFGGMTPQYADQTASVQTAKKGLQGLHHGLSKVDMPAMMNEPHHVLAMAFMQNIETFTKVLNDQAQGGSPLSADFARAAVAEITRNFGEAQSHHREHMKTMSPGGTSNARDMDVHDSRLKDAISTLEKEVQNYTLNSKRIAADCADVLKRLDEMSKMHTQE